MKIPDSRSLTMLWVPKATAAAISDVPATSAVTLNPSSDKHHHEGDDQHRHRDQALRQRPQGADPLGRAVRPASPDAVSSACAGRHLPVARSIGRRCGRSGGGRSAGPRSRSGSAATIRTGGHAANSAKLLGSQLGTGYAVPRRYVGRPFQYVATTGSGRSRPCHGLFRDRDADGLGPRRPGRSDRPARSWPARRPPAAGPGPSAARSAPE